MDKKVLVTDCMYCGNVMYQPTYINVNNITRKYTKVCEVCVYRHMYYEHVLWSDVEGMKNKITSILSDHYIGGRLNADEALREIHDIFKNE